ncbi:LEM domain-containing protein 1 isoform X1 [Trichomycterus rosablanca]|uniref:LEM domain-containing protein 1 isoform X1 n=1 Tax=Trichomycterus rosablanca TaxID=2290929 RepID=UPI002F357F56
MPVFMQNPAQFSIERLKSELISHRVKLPPVGSEKNVYVELYMKHVGNNNSPDFSSDEEEQVYNGNEEENEEEEEDYDDDRRDDSDMVDLSSLTDDQLKCKLLQYGVKPGPIVGSTRALYERKLQRLMTHDSQHSVNNKAGIGKYSDSEEEEEEEEDEDESGSEQQGPDSVSHTTSKQNKIENRLSPQSKLKDTERRSSQTPVKNAAQWDVQHLGKNGTTNMSLYLTPECLPHKKQTTTITPATEEVTDILTELFPDAAVTPTGITATKRRAIKGAAGRPVQFKYPETPMSPTTLERREIQQRLVPLWVQLVVFLFVVALLYFIYILMEEQSENPFSSLLNQDTLNQEPINNELDLTSSSAAPEINTRD